MKILFTSILSCLIILNFFHNFYLNIFSHSLPSGVYIKIAGSPKKGEYAASCLNKAIADYGIGRNYLAEGLCDSGSVPVMKLIKGVPGDSYFIQDGLLHLNGKDYPISQKDSSGRTLKVFYQQKQGTIPAGKYFLLSDFVKNSWDSRFWGPVQIQFLLKPLWIFPQDPSSLCSSG